MISIIQDLIMYNLTSEIEKLESEKNMLEVQIEKLNGKIDFLEQNISNANADYQVNTGYFLRIIIR